MWSARTTVLAAAMLTIMAAAIIAPSLPAIEAMITDWFDGLPPTRADPAVPR
jgi:hypothetical protein